MSKLKALRLNLLARLAALKTQSNLADLQLRQQLLQKQQLAYSQLQSYQDEYFNNFNSALSYRAATKDESKDKD